MVVAFSLLSPNYTNFSKTNAVALQKFQALVEHNAAALFLSSNLHNVSVSSHQRHFSLLLCLLKRPVYERLNDESNMRA